MEQHLSQYKIFYEVAKAGNISRAAKGLYISQPAISKSISKLEESLNVTLFVRNSRGVTLTMEGQMLYNHISDAFHSISIGEQQLRRIKDFHIGKIKIDCETANETASESRLVVSVHRVDRVGKDTEVPKERAVRVGSRAIIIRKRTNYNFVRRNHLRLLRETREAT